MYKDAEVLDFLVAASRGKHLFQPRKPQILRSVLKSFLGTGNKIDYVLNHKRGNPIPKEYIRLEPWETQYLYMVASRAEIGILEIGRLKGGSTLLLSAANKDIPIYSIDIAPKDDENLNWILKKLSLGKNVKLIVGDSQETKYQEIGDIDLLFIDGDHSHKGCLNDLENWWDSVAPGGHVILHDCYFGNGVQDAVIGFAKSHEVRFITSPYIVREHWRYPSGSFCHLIKI